MIWDKDKFEKEIKTLPLLVEKEDVLSVTELQNIRQRMLVTLKGETKVSSFRYIWAERKEKFMRYVISVLVGLSLFGGTAFASNSANPGDLLYPIKRVKEKVELSVTVSEQSKASLQAKFAEERLHELDDLNLRKNNQISTTATSTVGSNNNDDDKIEVEAKANAQVDVNNAINVLKQVRAKLETKGNSQAASAIGEHITRLQSGARSKNLKLEFEEERQNSKDENSRGSAETSTTKVKIEDDGRIKVEVKSEKNENRDSSNRRIEKEGDEDENDDDDNGRNIVNTTPPAPVTTTPATTVKTYSLAEVQTANSASKCWSIVSGSVYDLTSWISQHPGGQSAITSMCGKDSTSAFTGQHGGQARPISELAGFKIGILK